MVLNAAMQRLNIPISGQCLPVAGPAADLRSCPRATGILLKCIISITFEVYSVCYKCRKVPMRCSILIVNWTNKYLLFVIALFVENEERKDCADKLSYILDFYKT